MPSRMLQNMNINNVVHSQKIIKVTQILKLAYNSKGTMMNDIKENMFRINKKIGNHSREKKIIKNTTWKNLQSDLLIYMEMLIPIIFKTV